MSARAVRAVRSALAALGAQLELFLAPGALPVPAPPPARAPRPPLPTDAADAGRWLWTKPWLDSPHRARARRELEAVRAHFPELDGVAVTVGLTKRRGVLGLASLGAVPRIWIRPRRIHRFALAHELTHLLQARDLVPGGEKAADLYALGRSAAYVDVAPFYLTLPRRAKAPGGGLAPGAAATLHALAARAIAERRGKTARGAVRQFERAAFAAFDE